MVACLVEGPLPFPPGCTPATAPAGAAANGNGNGNGTAAPQQLSPADVLALLGAGIQIGIQTAVGIATIARIDAQGNYVTTTGEILPGTTPVILPRDEEEKPEWFENPAVQIGAVVVAGIILFGLFRN